MASADFDARLSALCDWASGQRSAGLPQRIERRARLVLADDLAAMVAAAVEPEVARYRALVTARAGASEATILAPGLPRTDRLQAISANGVAASWCELDEGYRRITCHAGLYVLPALLAEAETASLSLADVLRSLAVGYECATRIALCFRSERPIVHAHALYSAIGASAGIASARGYDAAIMKGAIATAATLTSVGPRSHLSEGVLARNAWAATGGVSGMLAADWSECGIRGTASSLPAVYADILGAACDDAALDAGLGEAWSIEAGYHKIYACCQHGHSAVEAVLGLRAREPLAPEAIDSIDVFTHPLALSLDNPRPATTLGAKFSMPHIVAAPLIYGSGGAEAFSYRALLDPTVARLRDKVRLHPYEGPLVPPHDRPARVVMNLAGGGKRVAECLSALGGPDRPLPDVDLIAKISTLSAPVLPGLGALLAEPNDNNDDADRPWRDVLASMRA